MPYEVKQCSRCLERKTLDQFHKSKQHRLGVCPWCKVCETKRYYEKKSTPEGRKRLADIGKRCRQKIRDAAFAAYGGYICACCGETEKLFLSIDHINGGGHKHRKSLKSGHFYEWLRDQKYPNGYQVLCMNCNCGRHRNGGICPHKLGVITNAA